MKAFFRALALSTALAAASLPALAQTTATDAVFNASTLNLSAYGETKIAPDMAIISLGVMTQAPTAAEAMRLNAARMTQVMNALTRQGIAERDIQTSNLNLSPQYDYRENQPPLLRGYQASNQVTIRVLDMARVGAAIDAVVAAGSNQINGISFGLQDPRKAEDAARRAAVEALQAKASLYSGALGKRIIRLVNLSEGGGYSAPPPMPMLAAQARFAKDESTSVSGGELTVRIDVSGVFEITR